MKKSLIADVSAGVMLDHQPPSIRRRLGQDEEFLDSIGRLYGTVFSLDGDRQFEFDALCQGVRRAWVKGKEEIVSIDGRPALLELSEGNLKVLTEPESGESEVHDLSFFALLAPGKQKQIRVKTLTRLLADIGPTGGGLEDLLRIVHQRPLTNHEVKRVLKQYFNGVSRLQSILTHQLHHNAVRPEDLVPQSLEYFERFVGPAPQAEGPEEYLTQTLPRYRKELLGRDLQQGLKICLMGALRDDLCPGAWLNEVDDETVKAAIQTCNPTRDPFSLLGVLDLCLYRQDDEELQAYAENAVEILLEEEFLNPDGIDLYELLPMLAEFIHNQINLLENAASRPPFWRRMCAWMQAVYVVKAMEPRGYLLDEIQQVLEAWTSVAGRYQSLLDLRHEPVITAWEYSKSALRRELARRLMLMELRHQEEGRKLPLFERLSDFVHSLTSKGEFLWLPGPLEGHLEAAQRIKAPDWLEKQAEDMASRQLAIGFYRLSSKYLTPKWLRENLRERAIQLADDNQIGPRERLAEYLSIAAIAAVERDAELAEVVVNGVNVEAPQLTELEDISMALRVLLLTSGAFPETEVWTKWLRQHLSSLAAGLPIEGSGGFYKLLQELKTVVDSRHGLLAQAETIALAGAV